MRGHPEVGHSIRGYENKSGSASPSPNNAIDSDARQALLALAGARHRGR